MSDGARQQMVVAMQVTTALASTVLAATENPSALNHVPSALRADHAWWVVDFRGGRQGCEMLAWESLEDVDRHLERCVPWLLLAGSEAWRAIIDVAITQPWFMSNGLSPEHATESPEMNVLTRWSLALMDEVGLMCSEPETMEADAELRELARVKRTLDVRKFVSL